MDLMSSSPVLWVCLRVRLIAIISKGEVGIRAKDKDKDLTHKDQDKDKDLISKDQDKDKDLKNVLKNKNKDKD